MIVGQKATGAAVTSATYPGTPDSVPEVRRLVRALFASSPRAYDLELIAAELVTNAIRHTPSGQEGGKFTVRIRHRPGRARLEVTDGGTSPWRPAQRGGDGVAEHGRGLQIVAALADEVGYAVTAGRGQAIWAVLTWLTVVASARSAPKSPACAGSPR
jgi:anti-sigma regulatory factor (Ser/Thr protein kinase)